MRERSALQALWEKYRDKGFVVLAIAMDPEGAKLVAPYKKKYGLTFPHLLDSDRLVAFTYGVRATPTNYFLDRDGGVVAASIGYRDWETGDAHALIEALLAEKERNPAEPGGEKPEVPLGRR